MGRARPSVCAFDSVGMKICWTARTAVARAWDGRLRARPSSAFDCMGMGIRGTARTVSRMRGTVDCLSSARVRLRLHVCARATATARRVGMENMGMKRRLRTSDCLSVRPAWENSPVSSVRVRLRLHDAWAWEAWTWKGHGAADGTSARAWDELDLVRLAALVRVVLVDVE